MHKKLPHSLPLTNPLDGVPLCTFKPVSESVIKNLILRSAPKLVSLIQFLLPCLWNVSTLSFLLSLFLLILPYPLASFLRFSKLLVTPLRKKKISWSGWTEELSSCLQSFLCLQDNWKTSSFSALWPPLCQQCLQPFTYQPGHSSETALLKIVNDLLLTLDDGTVPLLAHLDLSAAFDMIDYSILLHRLISEYKARPSTGFHPTLQTALSCQHPLLHIRASSHLFRCSKGISSWIFPFPPR